MADYISKRFLRLIGEINAALAAGVTGGFELVKDAVVGDPKSLTKATVLIENKPTEIICNFGVIKVAGLNVPFVRHVVGKETRAAVVLKQWPGRYVVPQANPNAGEVSAMALALAEAGQFGEELQKSPALRTARRAFMDIEKLWHDKAGIIWGLHENQAAHDVRVVRTVKSCLHRCKELPATPGVARHSGAVFDAISDRQWNAAKRILKALLPLKNLK